MDYVKSAWKMLFVNKYILDYTSGITALWYTYFVNSVYEKRMRHCTEQNEGPPIGGREERHT